MYSMVTIANNSIPYKWKLLRQWILKTVITRKKFVTVCGSGLKKAMAPHSSTLAWKIHGQRSLVGCLPWGR